MDELNNIDDITLDITDNNLKYLKNLDNDKSDYLILDY